LKKRRVNILTQNKPKTTKMGLDMHCFYFINNNDTLIALKDYSFHAGKPQTELKGLVLIIKF
jgi:hypothetical protein